jgi:2-phospho-L-lactate/phosphoenolpyruvate guanylyltransferase
MRGILLIPVKDLSNAKQRLGTVLDQAHRSQLAEAMLRDVMLAASGVRSRIDIALVTGDRRAKELAAEFDFLVIEDTRNESETAAIEMATAWSEEQDYDTTIVIPGDIPLARAEELHRVLDAAPEEGAVFVPAYDRRGSNCILRRPAAIIPLRFGNDSFLPHCEATQGTGKPLIILEMPGIGLDIDNPHELDLLLVREGDTNAQRLLRSWNFSVQSSESNPQSEAAPATS